MSYRTRELSRRLLNKSMIELSNLRKKYRSSRKKKDQSSRRRGSKRRSLGRAFNMNETKRIQVSLNRLKEMITKKSPDETERIYKIIKNYDKYALCKKVTRYDFTVFPVNPSRKIRKSEIKRMIKLIIQIIRKPVPNVYNKELLYNRNRLPKYLKKYKVLVIKNSQTKIIPMRKM